MFITAQFNNSQNLETTQVSEKEEWLQILFKYTVKHYIVVRNNKVMKVVKFDYHSGKTSVSSDEIDLPGMRFGCLSSKFVLK